MLGLSAGQLLPSLEYAQLSVRANVDYAFVSGGFPLQDTWQMLLPHVLTAYSPLYVGVIGLGLAFLTLGVRRREFTGPGLPGAVLGIGFFGLLALLALLVSYGANGFLYPLVYRVLPGWNLFRGQERAAYLVAFGLSVLAGYGAAALPAMRRARRAWLGTLFAGLVVAATYVFGLVWQLPGRTAVGQVEFLLTAAVTIALAATFAVMLRLPGWSVRRTTLLMVLAAINLFWANAATNLDSFGPARKAILPPEVEALQRAVAETAGGNAGLAGRAYNEFRVYEDYGLRAGVEDVWGASPLRLARYASALRRIPARPHVAAAGRGACAHLAPRAVRAEHAARRVSPGDGHDLPAPAGRAEPARLARVAGAAGGGRGSGAAPRRPSVRPGVDGAAAARRSRRRGQPGGR